MKKNNKLQIDEKILDKISNIVFIISKILFVILNLCVYFGVVYVAMRDIFKYMIKFNIHDKILQGIIIVGSITFVTLIFFVLVYEIIDLFDD